MSPAAVMMNLLAAAAALYDSKILVWDIAVADLRQGGSVAMVIFAVVVSTAFTALPSVLGLRWALKGRSVAALLVALVSLASSGAGYFILAMAFTP